MYFLRYACFANAHIRQVCSALQNFASLENPLIIRFFCAPNNVFSALRLFCKCSHTPSMLRFAKLRKP